MTRRVTTLAGLLLLTMLGCSATPGANFALNSADAKTQLAAMTDHRVPLQRPVVILDGFLDPGFGSLMYGKELQDTTGDDRVLRVQFFTSGSLDACRDKAVAAIAKAFPDEPVDIIGISMGGAVAFLVADSGQVNVSRVFTLSSPLRGAKLAALPTWMHLQRDLRPGSAAMTEVAHAIEHFKGKRIHYAGLSDTTVRATEAAPIGETAYWLPADGIGRFGHTGIIRDPRIRLDILRRLRGEPPITAASPVPLPDAKSGDVESDVSG